jgi:hypothetical protein
MYGRCIATMDGNAKCECQPGYSGPTCQISNIKSKILNLKKKIIEK